MKKIILLISSSFTTSLLFSQVVNNENKTHISLSGYVKSDFIVDSRQNYSAREGHFLFWPLPVKKDVTGKDINAKPNFTFLAVQSRLTLKATGPDAFKAKTSGAIEGDFFGQANDNINLFRLRQAYIKLNWPKTEFLFGQFWNPMFITKCYPEVISFNTGVPFQPFAQNPQVRITRNIKNIKIVVAALAQRDYTTKGINGNTSDYLRNSPFPDLHLQIHYEKESKENSTGFYTGAGISYKTIVPRLYNEKTIKPAYDSVDIVSQRIIHVAAQKSLYKVNEKVQSLSAIFYLKYKAKPVTVKFETMYGENSADVLSISGFGACGVSDSISGQLDYSPVKHVSVWSEIYSNGEKIQIGIFCGYTKNLGLKEKPVGNTIFGIGPSVESIFRISPRVLVRSDKFQIAGELEYTFANMGKTDANGFPLTDPEGIPKELDGVGNLRVLIGVYYFF